MTMALSGIPDRISVPRGLGELSALDELHTPFGLYVVLHELTARSRELAGTDLLFVGWRVSTISDPAGRVLPPVGAIDQYVDSADVTDRGHAGLRRRYIAGPRL